MPAGWQKSGQAKSAKCAFKSGAKVAAVQTLRDCRARSKFAKRLDCVCLSTAFPSENRGRGFFEIIKLKVRLRCLIFSGGYTALDHLPVRMELREFAEQILFAMTLEEKLRRPEKISDEHPRSGLKIPDSPGRPQNLIFKPHAAGKSDFPGLHRLEEKSERGKLLHFFGNHELLAVELMALVLLKFPDAPPAFRQGVLQTLRDEQEHTRLYLARMKSCGVEFGDFPVSGYFWRCVAPMEHPIDYVAGLSLTFEQANLDFARHFAKSFATIGDNETSQLLEKIYRDEIGHVAYGLKWFRRWKNPGENDWDAFCRTLKFPLSPQRAKGFSLNLAGRKAAGFDPHFIAEINVYSQSKGRTPSVFVFNPFAEGRLAGGKTFNPAKPQAQLARDLENLPQFLCRQDDIVLVNEKPSVEFLSRVKQAGFPLPEFVELGRSAELPFGSSGKNPPNWSSALRARKLGRLRPWAWGPDSFELLQPLFASVTGETRADENRFNEKIARLYSKSWSADFLRKIVPAKTESGKRKAEVESWLCTENEIGVGVNSSDEARAAIGKIRARGHHKIVVKQAFGVAGGNALRLFEPEILPAQWRWMENAFAQKRGLVVEPWLERARDFSVQLEMTAGGLKLCGFTGLLNDARGQFIANFAESHHHKRIPANVISQFRAPADISQRLLDFYGEIFAALETELRAADFSGPIGIDAFVYRDDDGAAKLKPIVEINPRFTMGRVLVELMRQVRQNCAGVFRLVNAAQLRAAGFENFSGFARRLEEKFPLELEGEPVPRIRSGALCLNDPSRAKVCLAVFQVGRALEPLLAAPVISSG
jgi:uncharacterized ferritin-like protein (DUF455 family)